MGPGLVVVVASELCKDRQCVCVCPDVSLVTVSVFQIQFYCTSHDLCLLLKGNLNKTANHTLFTKGAEGVV